MTSKMTLYIDEIIICNICPGECKSFSFYPDCNPFKSEIPHKSFPQTVNVSNEDFFGQFIKKTVRRLNRQDVQRFHDRLFIRCPECLRLLSLNPTSDDFLICSFCSIHWDLLQNRSVVSHDFRFNAVFRPDGSLLRWKVAVDHEQLNLEEIPF